MGKFLLIISILFNLFSVFGQTDQEWSPYTEKYNAEQKKINEKKSGFFLPELQQDTIEVNKEFDYKQVSKKSINGTDYLFGNLNHELPISNLIDENGKIDSFLMVKSMELTLAIEQLYNIPSSSELSKLFNGNYYSAQKEIKQKCLKTYTCSDPKKYSTTSYETYQLLNMATSIEGAQFLLFKHPHECKNCKEWSATTKSKMVCKKCFDSRTTYCGKSFTCLVCNGKGYRMLKTEQEKVNASDYLYNEGVKITNYQFYFNGISDFGIYIVDKNKTISYNEFIKDKSIAPNERVSVILSKNGDYFLNKLKEHNNLKIEDSILISNIFNLIDYNRADSASYLFGKINYPTNALRSTIQEALTLQYSNEIQTVDGATVNAFINDNKTKLLSLEPTTLEITMHQDETFEGITSDYITKSIVPKFKTINGFSVPLPLHFEVNISKGSPKKTENSQKYFIDTYKDVQVKNNGKVYVSNFFNSSMFHRKLTYYNPDQQKEYIKQHPELKSLKISEGHYALVESYQTEFFANGQCIGKKASDSVTSQVKCQNEFQRLFFEV